MAVDSTSVNDIHTAPGAGDQVRTRRKGGFRGLALIVLGLLVALIAQAYLIRHQYPLDGVAFYAVAVVLFCLGVRRLADAMPAERAAAYAFQWKRALPALLIGVVALILFVRERMPGTGAFDGTPGNGYASLLVWLAALLALVIAYWRQDLNPAGAITLDRRELLALGGIVALGLALRLFRLDAMPGNLYLDEGDHGLLALRLMKFNGYVHYVPDLTGHATLFFYGLGAWIKLFGLDLTAMRVYPVLIGMLAILATYFLAREMLGPRGALVAAFVMAISRWHITFSRYIFTAGMVTLAMALTLWLLIRALRTRRPLDFIWAGIAFGLGLTAYLPIRFVLPAVVGTYLVFRLLADRTLLRVHSHGLLLFVIAFLVAVMPLAVYFQKNPSMLLARASQASVQQDIERAGSNEPLKANIRKAFGMFNFEGDPRARHNLPLAPMLDPVTGVFFVLGAGYALWRLRKPEYALLLVWLVYGVVPGVMSLADSNPHSMRTIANIPAVCLLAALAAERGWTYVRTHYGRSGEQLLKPAAIIVAVVALGINVVMYFSRQAGNVSVYYDYDPVQTQVAREVVQLGASHQVYVAGAYTNHSAVKLLASSTPYQTFNQTQHLPVRDAGSQDVVFILEPVHRQLLNLFQKYYPLAQISEWKDRYGNTGFVSVSVPRQQAAAAQGAVLAFYRGSTAELPFSERSAETIVADWAVDRPLDAPFTAVWRSALYVSRYGNHALTLESTHPASVTLDSQVILDMPGGRQTVELSLFGGFHTLQVQSTVAGNDGKLSLAWRTPDAGEQSIPRTSLFSVDVATNGLVGKYYRGNSWAGAPAIQQKDLFIFPNDLLPAPFSIEWEGKIYAPRDGQYVFGTQSDDGSVLYIDGKVVVDNGGHHADRYMEGRITLTQGVHDIKIRYNQDDGGRVMELYWTPPGGRKEVVPTEALFPPSAIVSGTITLPEQVAIPTPGVSGVPAPGVQTPGAGLPVVSSIGEMAPLLVIGREGAGPGEFRNPRGVAVDKQGSIYVADTGNKRVQKLDSQGKFLAEWKNAGSAPFVEPAGIAIAANGDIYVLEPERDGAHWFTADGQYRGKIGDGLGLYRPRGLTIDPAGVLTFANTGGNSVVRTTADGKLVNSLGKAGTKNGELQQPTDAVVDTAGNVYVADTFNQRIQRFAADGRYLGQWTIQASGTSAGPHLAIAPDGVIYVSEPDAHRISAYAVNGSVLATWGGQGIAEGQLQQPVGVYVDGAGMLYIADSANHRIQVWGKR